MIQEKELVTKESAGICVYFNDFTRSRALSVSGIEELAKIPKNTLLNLLTTKRPIPANHIVSLVHILEHFGYRPQWDWTWLTSEKNPDRLIIDREQKTGIYFYFNFPNRKVTLHKGQCSFCNNGQGLQETLHGESNGGWRGPFDTYQNATNEAQTIAQEIGIPFTNCKRCNPQDT